MAAASAAAGGAEEPGMKAEELPRGCGGEDGPEDGPAAARGSPEGEGGRDPTQASVSNGGEAEGGRELVELKVIWNKNKYDVKFCLDSTGAELKQKIHALTGLPPAMQKVMFKGLLPEEKTLREIKVTNGAKIMVVGSTINDVLAVNTPKEAAQQEVKAEENKKEPLCRQKQHRKVLDKGKPDDVMPSVKGVQERLPTVPLSGMYNKSGGKVRLTFKLEQDQLWIGTKVMHNCRNHGMCCCAEDQVTVLNCPGGTGIAAENISITPCLQRMLSSLSLTKMGQYSSDEQEKQKCLFTVPVK
ncbi:ubiquitin domain-containing protein UBFD1 isoform X1 [Apus apus]|uniref:ubiquitin domain-containing protein UBFD1 isoform X1 n=1 Tax=Apus apus TaxID=8895 RepID=UPI0021F8B9E9|nr:ubiquitin domain-containing protein UBFD1 isoform X1 [Apus apus]